jgi:hypothetical protein
LVVSVSRKALHKPPRASSPNQCEILPHNEATNQNRCLPAHFISVRQSCLSLVMRAVSDLEFT